MDFGRFWEGSWVDFGSLKRFWNHSGGALGQFRVPKTRLISLFSTPLRKASKIGFWPVFGRDGPRF